MALSTEEAAHLLRRVGFGGTPDEITTIKNAANRAAAVDLVMDLSAEPPASYPAPSSEGSWRDWVNTSNWWVQRMRTSTTPLAEKMTLFWHSHFACGFEKVQDMAAMQTQHSILRTYGMGSFEELLRRVSISSAMLVYIDNESNVAGGIQENFARELMELHTIGVGNFTESDVVAMARAWTGHNVVGWNGSWYDTTYVFYPDRHDNGQKTLFGIADNWDGTGQYGGRSTIHELVSGAKQADTARFIARKVFKFFVHITPSDATVQNLANTFVASGMNVAALVRQVLLTAEFWDPATRYQLVKSPVEFVVSALRRTGIETPEWVHYMLESMGQTLFEPPNVAGWAQNGYWLSTASSWARGDLAWYLAWQADGAGFFDGLRDLQAAAGVQRMFDDLGIVEPTAATRARFESWFATARTQYSWAIQPVGVVLGVLSPEFQLA